MSRISSMARHEKGLIVQGTGYVSPMHRANDTSNGVAPLRRACSASQLGNSTCASSKVRVPFLPAGRGHAVRRAVQAASAKTRATKSKLNDGLSTTSSTSIMAANCCTSSTCKCQHPTDLSFLEDLYVQNLHTQIEVLEMENRYLRSPTFSHNKQQQSREPAEQPDDRRGRMASKFAVDRKFVRDPKSILVRTSNASDYAADAFVNGAQIAAGAASASAARRRSANQRRHYGGGGDAPPPPSRKRVEFAADARETSDDEAECSDDKEEAIYEADVSEQPTTTTTTLGTGPARSSTGLALSDDHIRRIQDEDLFLRLERAFQNEIALEEKLKAQIAENRRLHAAKSDASAKLRSYEESWASERRTLLEDNVELQRRLDALTPLLAEKEARLARLADEAERHASRARHAETRAVSLQARLEEQKREESLLAELDSDRKLELERIRERLRKLEIELHEARHAEATAKDELATVRQSSREHDAQRVQERAKYERELSIMRDASDALKEKVTRLEASARERETEQLVDAKRVESELRVQITTLEEQFRAKKEACQKLKSQLRDALASEERKRASRNRMAREFEALRALSDSLANENRGLRDERIAIDERILALQNKIFAKERDVADLTERLDEFKRKYNDAIERLSAEIARQQDTSEELEVILKRVHELSASIPRHVSRSPSPCLLDASRAEKRVDENSTSDRVEERRTTATMTTRRDASRDFIVAFPPRGTLQKRATVLRVDSAPILGKKTPSATFSQLIGVDAAAHSSSSLNLIPAVPHGSRPSTNGNLNGGECLGIDMPPTRCTASVQQQQQRRLSGSQRVTASPPSSATTSPTAESPLQRRSSSSTSSESESATVRDASDATADALSPKPAARTRAVRFAPMTHDADDSLAQRYRKKVS